ncbi:alpha-E domain-containing protein [Flavihumibacter profundi]|uniref:alpha-E domain-containing protein n=1 Tax=Flavihumibacter profundi TaxID=2716883 RepID=UPI001CC6A6B9|nr:alpha-E domain-containing protein [Flavihumibacter profundi]MBZ5857376.1 alpha-E domain-containing protein [Flavihumibacter profundi]
MLSRIADSLFWLNRYLERTDAILRTLHTNYTLSLDKGEYNQVHWRQLSAMFSSAEEHKREYLEQHPLELLQHLIYDTANTNAIRAMVIKARENARGAQDHITKEVWEQVNQVYHLINNPLLQQRIMRNDALSVLEQLGTQLIHFNGVADSTMPRNMGWNFMTLGKFIERCIITLELSDRNFAETGYELQNSRDVLYWRNLLLSLSGYELHLKNYRNPNHNQNVADQVLFNKQFTRSVIYCLDRIGFYLQKVVQTNQSEEALSLLKNFGRLHSKVEFADMNMLREKGIQSYLHEVKTDLYYFNHHLSHLFFSYA